MRLTRDSMVDSIDDARVAVTDATAGVSSPTHSGPMLASIVFDDGWAHLRDGAFVVKDEEREVKPFAKDPTRESRLWDATAELLNSAS